MLKSKMRSRKGQSLTEFAMAAAALIPVILLGFDAFLIIYAIQVNESACKEAARFASNGEPGLAYVRAQRTLESRQRNNGSLCVSQLVAVEANVNSSQLESLAPYGGQVKGVVDVTTDTEVKPLVVAWFLGKRSLSFQCTQELPVTYVMPNVMENGLEER